MHTRGTILLLIAVVMVGAWLWREGMPELEGPVKMDDGGAQPMPTIDPLLRIDPDTVTAVQLTKDGEVQRAERPAAGWAQRENGAKFAEFLDSLKGLGRIQEIAVNGNEWGEFGLEAAQRRVELEVAGSTPMLIEMGNRNPAATGIYTRIDKGSTVILMGALLDWEFEKLWRTLQETKR